jgi:hypothetical protein
MIDVISFGIAALILIIVARAIFSIGTIVKSLKSQNILLNKQNDLIKESIALSQMSLLSKAKGVQIQNKENGEILRVDLAEWLDEYQNEGSNYKIVSVD